MTELVMDEMVKLTFAIVLAVVVPLVVAILVRVLRRLGFDLDAEQQARAEKFMRDAILGAEEWAARRLKAKMHVASAEKAKHALAVFLARTPGVTQNEAERLLDQELPKVGAGAVAALKKVRRAVES